MLARARAGAYPTAEDLTEELVKLYEASKPLNNLILWSGRDSNVGRVRQINEDSVLTLEATALEHEGPPPLASTSSLTAWAGTRAARWLPR